MERMVLRLAEEFAPGNDSAYVIESVDTNGLPPWFMHPKLVKVLNHERVLKEVHRSLKTCDLVHVQTAWGDNFHRAMDVCDLALKAGKPTLLQLQSGKFATWFEEEHFRDSRERAALLFERVTVAVLSEGWIPTLSSLIPSDRTVVIPNAADPAEWPYFAHPGPSAGVGPFRWITAGRVERPKGLWELLRAAEPFPKGRLQLQIFGRVISGPAEGRVQLAKQRGVALVMSGEASPAALAASYAQSDAFVFPSHYEGLPVALVEAMMSGLPVIATRVGAIPEMLAGLPVDQTIPPQDTQALRDAMERVMAMSPSEREALGRANHERAVARYSIAALRAAAIAAWDRLRLR